MYSSRLCAGESSADVLFYAAVGEEGAREDNAPSANSETSSFISSVAMGETDVESGVSSLPAGKLLFTDRKTKFPRLSAHSCD